MCHRGEWGGRMGERRLRQILHLLQPRCYYWSIKASDDENLVTTYSLVRSQRHSQMLPHMMVNVNVSECMTRRDRCGVVRHAYTCTYFADVASSYLVLSSKHSVCTDSSAESRDKRTVMIHVSLHGYGACAQRLFSGHRWWR